METVLQVIQLIIIIGTSAFVIGRLMPVKGVMNITTQEAKKKFKESDIQFIDVRKPHEYGANRRKPFINIPLSVLGKRLNELDKTKEVVVICQSGMRSIKATKILRKHGFEKVVNVKGGMSTWV